MIQQLRVHSFMAVSSVSMLATKTQTTIAHSGFSVAPPLPSLRDQVATQASSPASRT